MDDVDGVQAQIARNMLTSGDWVSARLDGVPYLEKSPLIYWMMAGSYSLFGVSDAAARLPIVLSILALCELVYAMGCWAISEAAGFYAGLVLGGSIGVFLFTRILIPDITLTLTIAFALWALLRALDEDEPRPRTWAALMAASMGVGLLLKGLIALAFPAAAGVIYLFFSGQLFLRRTWQRIRPFSGTLILLAVAAPWHVLATLRNPPYFDFSMTSGPGKYRGFFWYYFFNEHILRFLNRRWPRDYNTVPRHLFWLFHLLWFFPWSAYLPSLAKLQYRGQDRAARMRLLALCWIGFILIFFSFSTTQEYYSMPTYPAFALLLGSAMAEDSRWIRRGARVLSAVCAVACCAIGFILWNVWSLPTPGDISQALTQNPEMYTLSLGHMGDLTLRSFAYLKLPLALAGTAFLLGALAFRFRALTAHLAAAAMMVLFLNAARIAMQTFDPYLSSAPLARVLRDAPKGEVIFGDQYYVFSSVFFYADLDRALLYNGRYNNLEYGSYAPGAPDVFLNDETLAARWRRPERAYLILEGPKIPAAEKVLGREWLHLVKESGGKALYTNSPWTVGVQP
ncbi:MAG: glycosyltransferase family 39 protein [Acidobacteria bacterium]|nr:glycosyltransferase family 39 protein [Acidobacteriota bacterium]